MLYMHVFVFMHVFVCMCLYVGVYVRFYMHVLFFMHFVYAKVETGEAWRCESNTYKADERQAMAATLTSNHVR